MQNKTFKLFIFLPLLLLTQLSTAQNWEDFVRPPERDYSYHERELIYLLELWPGEYDNVEQLEFEKVLNKTIAENKTARMHSFVRHISLPAFGDHVLYLESYENDDPNQVTQQAIYQLTADETANAIRVSVFHFIKPNAILSKNQDLDLTSLSPDDESLKKGCDLLLRRFGMSFEGRTEDTSCLPVLNNQMLEDHVLIEEGVYQQGVIRRDATTGHRLQDQMQDAPYLLERARRFVCMIDFPNETNKRPTITKHYIHVHDQGGKFSFDYPDGRKMVLGMRNTWSFGMNRETFVIFLQEGSQKGKTLIYSWGNPGADRIGFNPGWIRVQCDMDNDRNVRLQHGLRSGS